MTEDEIVSLLDKVIARDCVTEFECYGVKFKMLPRHKEVSFDSLDEAAKKQAIQSAVEQAKNSLKEQDEDLLWST